MLPHAHVHCCVGVDSHHCRPAGSHAGIPLAALSFAHHRPDYVSCICWLHAHVHCCVGVDSHHCCPAGRHAGVPPAALGVALWGLQQNPHARHQRGPRARAGVRRGLLCAPLWLISACLMPVPISGDYFEAVVCPDLLLRLLCCCLAFFASWVAKLACCLPWCPLA